MTLKALQEAEKYSKAHRRRKRWRRAVTVLAAIVVFCTTYALILPAVTMENEPQSDIAAYSSRFSYADAISTKDFIRLNMYNYGSDINDNYKSNKIYPGFQQDNGTLTVYSMKSSNFGNNITQDLAAGITNVTNQGGLINATNSGANKPLVGAMAPTLINGYPQTADGANLKYLFDSPVNTENVDGLFQYDKETGEYWFDSRRNHAQYSNNQFTLYDQIVTPNFIWYPFGNFLPFDDITTEATKTSDINRQYFVDIKNSTSSKTGEYKTLSTALSNWIAKMDSSFGTSWTYDTVLKNASYTGATHSDYGNLYSLDYDKPTDFFFGMDMKMSFVQPKNGITGPNGDREMVFNFSGDDDVWVYIDGKLVLDLSGIHRHVGGSINFATGTVTYRAYQSYTNAAIGEVYETKTFKELGLTVDENGRLKDYSVHDFHFYYMERGAGSSVCEINFNFPILKKNSVAVTKELTSDVDVSALGNPDFKFQLIKENGTDLFVGPYTPFTIVENGAEIGTGMTDADGVFTLKAGQTAWFDDISEDSGKYFVRELFDSGTFGQYGQITVSGEAITERNDVTVGDETFTGADSPVRDISDGNTHFIFENKISVSELGSLSVQKTLTEYSKSRAPTIFTFEVKLDGELLPVGTSYYVDDVQRTVDVAGQISVAAGQTAVINNIIAGTSFELKETEASADGYVVSYLLNDVSQSGEGVVGTVETKTTAEIAVNNAELGATVTIPVHKTLKLPDGNEHSYTIRLEMINSPSDPTAVEPAFLRELTLNITNDPVEAAFELGYSISDFDELPQILYYKITELKNENDTVETVYDESVYVVEVTVQRAGNDFTAAVTGLWKNGEKQTDGATVSFENSIRRYELPQTGGVGVGLYVLGGAALTVSAAAVLMYNNKKRRKGDA